MVLYHALRLVNPSKEDGAFLHNHVQKIEKTFCHADIHISKTFRRILADPRRHTPCNNTISEAISRSFSHFHISFGRVPSPPMTTGTILTSLHFQSLCTSLFTSWYYMIFSLVLQPTLVSKGHATSMMKHSLVFLSSTIIFGLLAWTRWSVCMQKSQSILYLSDSSTLSGVWLYHFSFLSKPNLSHRRQCITRLSSYYNNSEPTLYIPPQHVQPFHSACRSDILLVDSVLNAVCSKCLVLPGLLL